MTVGWPDASQGVGLDEAGIAREADRFGPVRRSEFPVDRACVALHGKPRQVEPTCDLDKGEVGRQILEHA